MSDLIEQMSNVYLGDGVPKITVFRNRRELKNCQKKNINPFVQLKYFLLPEFGCFWLRSLREI